MVLTSTHNLCFGAKLRTIGTFISLHTPVLLYKWGLRGVYISRTYFHDGRRKAAVRKAVVPFKGEQILGPGRVLISCVCRANILQQSKRNNSNLTNSLHSDWLFGRFYTSIKAMGKNTCSPARIWHIFDGPGSRV